MSNPNNKISLDYKVGDILILNSVSGEYKNVPVRVYRIQQDPIYKYHVRDLNYMSDKTVDNNNVNYGAMTSELSPLTKLNKILA